MFILLGNVFGQPGAKDAEDLTTVLGCVHRSNQSYSITDNHGSSYVLAGVGDRLSGEVGHALEVKGKLTDDTKARVRSERQSSNPNNTEGAVEQSGTIWVADVISDVHRVADHCPSH